MSVMDVAAIESGAAVTVAELAGCSGKRAIRADGSRINSVKAVGLLEMDGPKILRFSDYFDTRQSGMKPAS